MRILSSFFVAIALCVCVETAAAQTDLNRTMEEFDEVRALAMRGLLRAQEMKTAYLYGRGFGMTMPESIPEDMLIEGLWLFDYLSSMDYAAMSLVSYAAAAEHPNLDQELDVFRSFMPEAARKTVDYYDRASKGLADAVKQVNAVAAERAPFNLETITPRPFTDDPTQAIAGDGFTLGWSWTAMPGEASNIGRHFQQHGYSKERMFELAVKAGIEFIRPTDRNIFEWDDVEKEEGTYDWSRVDEMLALFKKYDLDLWLPVPVRNTRPPQWLQERLGNEAVLTNANGAPLKVGQNNFLNMLNPEVSKPFCRYIQNLITHVKQSDVKIHAVELGDTYAHFTLPYYSGPEAHVRWQAWLKKNKIDPCKSWSMDVDTWEALLPDKLTPAIEDPPTENHKISVVPARVKPTIDGKCNDWDLTGGVFVCNAPELLAGRFGCWVHLMYDKGNLYIAARWTDDTPLNHPGDVKDGKGWEGDCLQFRLITAPGSPQSRAAHFTCWQDKNGADVIDIAYGLDFKGDNIKDAQAVGAKQEFFVPPEGGRYTQEISLPWKLLTKDGKPPKPNDQMTFTIEANFINDSGNRLSMKDVFRPEVPLERFYMFDRPKQWGSAAFETKGNLKPRPVRLADGRELQVTMKDGRPTVDWGYLLGSKKNMILDLQRWRDDEYIEYFRPQVRAIREVAPELPICTKSCDAHEGNESLNGRPDERLIRELGLVAYGYANGVNIWDNLRRSYSSAHWSATSTHTGSGNAFSQYAFSSYIHGTLTIMTGPVPIARGFYWGDSFWYPDMRWRWSALGGWRRFQERAQGMAPEMLNTKPAPQVAMLWSDTSHKYQAFVGDYVGGSYGFKRQSANYHKIGCVGWGRILESLCLAYDIVTEEQVREGKLQEYEMLLMPGVQALPEDVAMLIRSYVEKGGKVVATSAPALFGDDMQQKGGGQLADVFGADFDRFLGKSVVAETPMGTPVLNEPTYGYWDGPKGGGNLVWIGANTDKESVRSDNLRTVYCAFKPRKGARVLELFADRKPAVVMNSFGQGKAVVIGYPMGRESFLSDIYHEHYGHNWADWPNGSSFQQGIFRWVELLLPKIGLERDAVMSKEITPRATGQDAGWPCWQWTRKGGGYRDYVWKTGKMRDTTTSPAYGDAAPRSVELTFRTREDNPNTYLSVFNREGGYGFDPGVVHFEATSKDIKIEMPRTDIRHIYDLSLGCPIPFKSERTRGANPKDVTTFRTMIEPSMARMLVVATQDDTIRKYSGNRNFGRGDDEIRQTVGKLATAGVAPDHVTIAPADVSAFLAERGARGITISCESPTYLRAARRLAEALELAYGKPVRISRNSPRIWGKFSGLGVWRAEVSKTIEDPDILLGSHNESHYIAGQRVCHERHTAQLPIVTSHTFPGPGRSVITLLRPFRKRNAPSEGKLFAEDPVPTKLVVGASDIEGLKAAVENVIKLIPAKPAK